jgi:hypothetical protein
MDSVTTDFFGTFFVVEHSNYIILFPLGYVRCILRPISFGIIQDDRPCSHYINVNLWWLIFYIGIGINLFGIVHG